MKRFTFLIALALLFSTTMSLASEMNDLREVRKIKRITLKEAVQDPVLVVAMLQQLDPSVLNNDQHYYILRVRIGWNIYEISGTYDQWVRFFNTKWKYPVKFDTPAVAN